MWGLYKEVIQMEEFKKYPKIKQLGHEDNQDIFLDPEDTIYLQEKMDGANFRFMVKDGSVIFGSRTQQLTSDKGEDDNMAKNFVRSANHVRGIIVALGKPHMKALEGFMFFGECMVRHTMPYDWDKIPPYLGFDIYQFKDEVFLNQDIAKPMFEEVGLDFVPTLTPVKAYEMTKFTEDDVPLSKYPSPSSPDQKAEGVVFKNYAKQIYAKFVREAFKEANAETFGGTPKYEETDSGKIVAKYCTNPRIDKQIFSLVDHGEKLDLPLMKYLPTNVWKDIVEEHYKDILISKYKIDIGKIRKLVTKRCLAVLKQVMVNSSMK